MRKNIWIWILAIILVIVPNYPSNIGYGQKATTLKFKDLEQVMMKNNPSIEINNNVKSNLFDAIRDIENSVLDKKKLENSIKEMELKKTILQLDMGDQSIIWGAQNLYLGYANLKRNRDELVQSLELFDDQITIMTLQEKLGMITTLDLQSLSNQREQMIFTMETLDDQMDNLLGEINLMLGDDFDQSLELEDSFEIDKKFISKMDYEKDKKLAKNSSYSIRLKNYDYHIQNDTMLWENKNGTSDNFRTAKRNADNAIIELGQEQKNLDLIFSKAYKEVESKASEVENEKKNLEYEKKLYDISELKHKLGMISKMEFKDAKAKFDSQNNKLQTLEQDLFQKSLQYKALLKGMNFLQ